MAQNIYRPNAEGDQLDWTPNTGADHYEHVYEVIPDEAVTYVKHDAYTPDGVHRDCWHIQNPGVELDGRIINWVEVWVRTRCNNVTCGEKPFLRTGGTDYIGDFCPDHGYTWQDYGYRWTVNPNTSLPWTKADITALQIGIDKALGPNDIRCTQGWLLVDHSAAAAAESIGMVDR